MTLEELQAQFVELQDKYKQLEANHTSQKTTLEESEKRIKELQDVNQKLFLKVTTPVSEQPPEEFKSILLGDEYTKVLDKQEIEFIKQVEEEIE